jgi:hypothetical protein
MPAIVSRSNSFNAAYVPNKKRKYQTPFRRPVFKGVTRYPKYAPVLRQAVRKEIGSLAEKRIQNYETTLSLQDVSTPIWSTVGGGILPLSPFDSYLSISQSSAQGGRNGNSIRPTRAMFKFVAYPTAQNAPFNATPRPQDVMMWFVKFKGTANNAPSLTRFFQNGNFSNTFAGNITDFNRTVNIDAVTLLGTHSFKLGYASYSGTGSTPAQQSFANNDYKMNVSEEIDITKYLAKEYKFEDNVSNTATTDATFVVIACCNADGTQHNGSEVPAKMYYNLEMKYTDF